MYTFARKFFTPSYPSFYPKQDYSLLSVIYWEWRKCLIFKGFLKHGFSAFHPVFYDLNNSNSFSRCHEISLETLQFQGFFLCLFRVCPLI